MSFLLFYPKQLLNFACKTDIIHLKHLIMKRIIQGYTEI